MKTSIKSLLHPSVVDFLESLERRTGFSQWVYGDFTIVIDDTGSLTTNLERHFDTSDNSELLSLLVYNSSERQSELLFDSNLMSWTADKLKSLLIKNTAVTVEHLADQFTHGKVMFYKKTLSGYSACKQDEADWVSLPADEFERFLPMGYPLIFIEFELSSRALEFKGKTPDICADVDEFFKFYCAGMTEVSSKKVSDAYGDDISIQLERTIRFEGNTYSVFYKEDRDCEGTTIIEEWKMNGKLHRQSGPAKTNFNNPYIPEEGYLAQDVKYWYRLGNFIQSQDTTDESIITNWHPAKKIYFGYL